MAEHKQCSYSLSNAIKQARQYRDKVESQFNGSDMRRMWQGLQTIMDYKVKTSHVADTNVLLPDKQNTFARFEDNTVPPMRPITKDCGLSSAADMSKTFKRVNPRRLPALAGCRPRQHP